MRKNINTKLFHIEKQKHEIEIENIFRERNSYNSTKGKTYDFLERTTTKQRMAQNTARARALKDNARARSKQKKKPERVHKNTNRRLFHFIFKDSKNTKVKYIKCVLLAETLRLQLKRKEMSGVFQKHKNLTVKENKRKTKNTLQKPADEEEY